MSTTTLYRFFDEDDRLLYVGISLSIFRRWQQHEADKPWWRDTHRSTLEHFPTRPEATEAELRAIRDEHPVFNVAGRTPLTSSLARFRYANRLSSWAQFLVDRSPGWLETTIRLDEVDLDFDLRAPAEVR